MKKFEDKLLQEKLEMSLVRLLNGGGGKTKEERDELRMNINSAVKFLAVKHKLGDGAYGSGFSNGGTKGDDDDERIDDE